MDKIPEPKVLTLDPNDENIILGIPDENPDPSSESNEPVKEKKVILSKSRQILIFFLFSSLNRGNHVARTRDIEIKKEVLMLLY